MHGELHLRRDPAMTACHGRSIKGESAVLTLQHMRLAQTAAACPQALPGRAAAEYFPYRHVLHGELHLHWNELVTLRQLGHS